MAANILFHLKAEVITAIVHRQKDALSLEVGVQPFLIKAMVLSS